MSRRRRRRNKRQKIVHDTIFFCIQFSVAEGVKMIYLMQSGNRANRSAVNRVLATCRDGQRELSIILSFSQTLNPPAPIFSVNERGPELAVNVHSVATERTSALHQPLWLTVELEQEKPGCTGRSNIPLMITNRLSVNCQLVASHTRRYADCERRIDGGNCQLARRQLCCTSFFGQPSWAEPSQASLQTPSSSLPF